MMHSLLVQIIWLLVLSIPVACVARTVVYEEVFREIREYCTDRSKSCNRALHRKFFYLFTCEYCFSHYIAIIFLALTGFKLLLDDWRGYIISLFSVVFIANIYLGIFARLKLDIHQTRVETKKVEKELGDG